MERLMAKSLLRTSYANVFQIGHSPTFNGKYRLSCRMQRLFMESPALGLPLQFNNTAYLERHDDYKDTCHGGFS